MTEMTSDPPGERGEIVGRGDGYTIQITEVDGVEGVPIKCDCEALECHARAYADARRGLLPVAKRDWYSEPQGHGGPMYDRCTCNTYISWLLDKCCTGDKPSKPPGAWGWGAKPTFPGSKRNSRDNKVDVRG